MKKTIKSEKPAVKFTADAAKAARGMTVETGVKAGHYNKIKWDL